MYQSLCSGFNSQLSLSCLLMLQSHWNTWKFPNNPVGSCIWTFTYTHPLVLSTRLPLHSYILFYLARSNLSVRTQLKWSLLWQDFPNLIPYHEQWDFVFFYDLWENKTKPYNNYNYHIILSGMKPFLNQTKFRSQNSVCHPKEDKWFVYFTLFVLSCSG